VIYITLDSALGKPNERSITFPVSNNNSARTAPMLDSMVFQHRGTIVLYSRPQS
jgi:hypothetical protein